MKIRIYKYCNSIPLDRRLAGRHVVVPITDPCGRIEDCPLPAAFVTRDGAVVAVVETAAVNRVHNLAGGAQAHVGVGPGERGHYK